METNLNNKKNYFKDTVILLQGSIEKAIFIVNQGSVEIKKNFTMSSQEGKFSEKEIIKNSKKVCIIEANGIFGFQNLLNNQNHENSYIALTDCIISKYIIPSNDAINFFKSNLSLTMNILSRILEQINKDLLNIKKYIDFNNAINKVSDNLSLIYSHVTQSKNDKLYNKFIINGGTFPPLIDSSFLTGDNSSILGKSYGNKSNDPIVKYDYEKIKFFHNISKANPQAFTSLINSDFKIFIYILESLSAISNSIKNDTEKFSSDIQDKCNYFFLENLSPLNLIVTISSKIKNASNIDSNFTNSIVKISKNIDQVNKQLFGREYTEIYPKYDLLSSEAKSSSTVNYSKTEEVGKYKLMFKDSAKKILEYSTLDDETCERIRKNIAFLRKNPTEEAISKESRSFMRKMQTDYFELYKSIALKILKKPVEIPQHIKLFLYFSYIDEALINEKQLEFISKCTEFLQSAQILDYPVITLFDFLKLIYSQEEEPSLAEWGEFRKLVKKPVGRSQKVLEDTPQGRIDFEIDNMVSMSLRITSNNPRQYVPYLMETSFKGPLNQIFVLPKKLDALIKKVVSIDFSLFFRELTWKIPGKSELIKKEIRPYMILVPTAGLRVQMWQEMVYSIRATRARFLVPIIFNGDLFKNLIFASGHFRWNMNKALVTNWMDPVEGGLTGAYYDYEQSYRKIPDLSDEIKDKIKKQIKSVKIDRNRFALDYYDWIVFESQGIPKLNRVLRKIFYRLIPFPKTMRDNISTLPVYSELYRKYDIISLREFKRFEAKFKKYAESGTMPEDLEAFLNMLQG